MHGQEDQQSDGNQPRISRDSIDIDTDKNSERELAYLDEYIHIPRNRCVVRADGAGQQSPQLLIGQHDSDIVYKSDHHGGNRIFFHAGIDQRKDEIHEHQCAEEPLAYTQRKGARPGHADIFVHTEQGKYDAPCRNIMEHIAASEDEPDCGIYDIDDIKRDEYLPEASEIVGAQGSCRPYVRSVMSLRTSRSGTCGRACAVCRGG